jgi:hypothetical protein
MMKYLWLTAAVVIGVDGRLVYPGAFGRIYVRHWDLTCEDPVHH